MAYIYLKSEYVREFFSKITSFICILQFYSLILVVLELIRFFMDPCNSLSIWVASKELITINTCWSKPFSIFFLHIGHSFFCLLPYQDSQHLSQKPCYEKQLINLIIHLFMVPSKVILVGYCSQNKLHIGYSHLRFWSLIYSLKTDFHHSLFLLYHLIYKLYSLLKGLLM